MTGGHSTQGVILPSDNGRYDYVIQKAVKCTVSGGGM